MSNLIYSTGKALSYSKLDQLNTCPRLFELTWELELYRKMPASSNIHFAYGHATAEGMQALLAGESFDKAILITAMAWVKELPFNEGTPHKGKTIWHAISVVQRFAKLLSLPSNPFADYEVAIFEIEGKQVPAVELTFTITDLPEGYVYDGHIDCILRKKNSNAYVVLEEKTSSMHEINELQYKYSLQALGYSIVLETIAKQASDSNKEILSSYSVFYWVTKPKTQEFEALVFTKTLAQKREFILSLIAEIARIQVYQQLGHFPQNGSSCLNFSYPCKMANICGLSNKTIEGLFPEKPVSEVAVAAPVRVPHFTFPLSDILTSIGV